MKILNILAAAAVVATPMAITSATPAAAQVSVSIGAPAGPGWYRWHERRGVARGWDGPVYYRERGPHYGWYNYNNTYYQNCSWRWGPHRRHREWQCW